MRLPKTKSSTALNNKVMAKIDNYIKVERLSDSKVEIIYNNSALEVEHSCVEWHGENEVSDLIIDDALHTSANGTTAKWVISEKDEQELKEVIAEYLESNYTMPTRPTSSQFYASLI